MTVNKYIDCVLATGMTIATVGLVIGLFCLLFLLLTGDLSMPVELACPPQEFRP